MTVYEGMFLLDNDLVRAGWPKAKSTVSGLLEKHGGKMLAARRWDERRLAYRIQRKNRATFLLTHYEIPSTSISSFQRDLEINESVLRYLLLKVREVPAQELELSRAEEASDFVVPEPPDDSFDEPIEETPGEEERGQQSSDDSKNGDTEETSEEKPAKKGEESSSAPEGSGENAEPALAAAESEEKKES